MTLFDRKTEMEKLKEQKEDEEGELTIQSDEAMAKAVIGLLKTQDEELMSEINIEQHKALAALSMRASKYQIGCLQTYINNWLKLMVSFDRKGRKEITAIAQAIRHEEGKRSALDKVRGFLGMGDEY